MLAFALEIGFVGIGTDHGNAKPVGHQTPGNTATQDHARGETVGEEKGDVGVHV
jgi:hypothetical protein